MSEQGITRREFVSTATGAVVGTILTASSPAVRAQARRRYAIVGTGVRGIGMWGTPIARRYADAVEFVGLSDINPIRLETAKKSMGVSCPTFTSFDEMMDKAKPDLLMVTTVDGYHSEYIVKALNRGIDVMTEKPMVIDEKQCQAVLDAEKRAGRKVVVTFNYRYAPKHQKIFRKNVDVPPYMQLPGSRAGAMSCLTGIAARKSCDDGKPITIADLVKIPT
jgi:threonine dehydrogenase-like Zn-dependent dehydrogenase